MPIRLSPDKILKPLAKVLGGTTGVAGKAISGGARSAFSLSARLFDLVKNYPKIGALITALGGGVWWSSGGGAPTALPVNQVSYGAVFEPAVYDSVEVFEPLAEDPSSPLPRAFSLEKYAPPVEEQGGQNSCVGWATAYAARTIAEAYSVCYEQPERDMAFSPSFVYNTIKPKGDACAPSSVKRAMDVLLNKGVPTLGTFTYTPNDCTRLPDASADSAARGFTIAGYQCLSANAEHDRLDPEAMRQYIAQGGPVVITMRVGGMFADRSLMNGRAVWEPTAEDRKNRRNFFGHAMCVIGYDQDKFPGECGFLIMNSWGPEWGDKGKFWIRSSDLEFFCMEAYAMYPLGRCDAPRPTGFDATFGLAVVDDEGKPTGDHIALKHQGGRVFRTSSPIRRGTRFKLEVTNRSACHLYVFGEETDGSIYALFPYGPKISAFCGIVGKRLFPRESSLMADSIGSSDVMTILLTEHPVRYEEAATEMSGAGARGMASKLEAVLGADLKKSVTYTDGATIGATCTSDTSAVAFVLRIDKR